MAYAFAAQSVLGDSGLHLAVHLICGRHADRDPQTLWDLGFQLSALAIASLFAYGKGVAALLLRTPLRAG